MLTSCYSCAQGESEASVLGQAIYKSFPLITDVSLEIESEDNSCPPLVMIIFYVTVVSVCRKYGMNVTFKA